MDFNAFKDRCYTCIVSSLRDEDKGLGTQARYILGK
jgi:hypothetical protein